MSDQKEFQSIDMTRGKPCEEQLRLSDDLFKIVDKNSDFITKEGFDVRNYGCLEGIVEARELMGEILEEDADRTLVIGSSSLQLMYDAIARAMQFGICGNRPWNALGLAPKFICPSPGYDRHFFICENFKIEMIPVKMKNDGPDMDKIEEIVATDDSIKGIWCVPQYSNPTAITYSDDVVKRLACMKTKATDFRIFWDNAYAVHHLYEKAEVQSHVFNIAKACKEAGNENRYFKFGSLSKVTFPGAGISAIASSSENIADIKKHLRAQMIGSDKINQLRHVEFLKSKSQIEIHMQKHAQILRPKFELIEQILEENLKNSELARWTKPKGGYFISFDCIKKSAKDVIQKCFEMGVKFTPAGSTWPYGNDPHDSNIRIAPSMPSLNELEVATETLCKVIKE